MDIKYASAALHSLNDYVNILIEHANDAIRPDWRGCYIQGLVQIKNRSYEIERSLIDG